MAQPMEMPWYDRWRERQLQWQESQQVDNVPGQVIQYEPIQPPAVNSNKEAIVEYYKEDALKHHPELEHDTEG